MTASIELQVISKILTTDDQELVDALCAFDESYYSVFKDCIHFILKHRQKYNSVPDVFTFLSQFEDIELVEVNESEAYLIDEIQRNKKAILIRETFNKLKDLGSGDVDDAWEYLDKQCEIAASLNSTKPMDIVSDAVERSNQIVEFSKQARIPTGFPEIDKLMYGGLSTVEELLIILARTNTGKSWVCTKMMESAQKNGFPSLYYSPEMQASFIGARFDTWRGHFQNSQLYRGNYNTEYINYINSLSKEETPAFVLEDKDVATGAVNTRIIENLVRQYKIKLVIVDGLSYVEDYRGKYNDTDYIKYKNVCTDLFKISKRYGCAIVVAMQANRETRDMKDDKGEVFPNLYAAEGSDHPARIATQAFAIRQIFDRHVLDIRLEKSRMANNQKPVLSYSWDVNTGRMTNIQGEDGQDAITSVITPIISPVINGNNFNTTDDDFTDDCEF